MSTYPELPPPDIDVIIATTTVSPTIYVPTLPTCIVGPCYQIVEVTESGAPNSAALLSLPAFVASDTDAPAGTYTVPAAPNNTFGMKVNGGAEKTYTLTAGAQTPTFIAAEINAALVTNGLDSLALAEVIVGSAAGTVRLQIRTKGSGSTQSVQITTGGTGLLTALGLSVWRAVGVSAYAQERIKASPYLFPVPSGRNNLDQLTFDPDEVTVAIDEGGASLRALSADSAFERYMLCDGVAPSGNKVIDDGDADGYSNLIELTDAELSDEFGTADAINGVGLGEIAAAAAPAVVTGAGNLVIAAIDGLTLIMSVSGSPWQTITFASVVAEADVVNQINAVFPGLASHAGGASPLVLDTTSIGNGLAAIGREAYINIHKNSTALAKLDPGGNIDQNIIKYWDNATLERGMGAPFPVAVDDEFYINGVLQGTVTAISGGTVGALTCQFTISNELAHQDLAGKHLAFKSKNLSAAIVPSTTPTPEVSVSSDGEIRVKNNIVRDSTGKPMWHYFSVTDTPLFYGSSAIYLGYKALRKDVTAAATTPELLSFEDSDDIDDQVGPISTDNPFAMACYLAKVNCPGRTLYGIGVSAVDDTDVYGTSAAYTEAMDYLAGHDIYTIVPLTQNITILQNWKTHVETYSGQTKRLERCCFGTVALPTRYPNTAAASGTDGTNPTATTFQTSLPALTALLLAAGIDPTVADMTSPDLGVYLNIETNAENYHVKSVSGSIITIQAEPGPPPHEFYAAADFTALGTLLNEAFSVMIRGAEVSTKLGVAQALADIGNSFDSNRMIIGAPGEVAISDSGLTMRVPSFYAAAVEGGKACQLLPHVGFTNTTAPGIEDVYLSNNYFNATHMNIAAAGGIWWWFKPTPSSAVTCRHQLTTDTSTIESREWNLLRPLDYLAKMLRLMLRPWLGQYNITEDLMTIVSNILDGTVDELVNNKKIFTTLEFGDVTAVDGAPDSLQVSINAYRIYPFNKMTATIYV